MSYSSELSISHLSFSYENGSIPVFNDVTLQFNHTSNTGDEVPFGLYGIIGPSGKGKTTLISILGGQLKPENGSILINGNDIYSLYDVDRRQLIAYQMQTATSLRGTVRENLIFGILETSDQNQFGDDALIKLLKNVGLWEIFEGKKGLDTIIGEGGLNLSGGQRQRLNFASLYLRAGYYKPVLILIDEPTSSLDEISEKAITGMIEELASHAIVLVVAHRLVTLKQAKGVFDVTLLKEDLSGTLYAYSYDQLLKHSSYYASLIENSASLDE